MRLLWLLPLLLLSGCAVTANDCAHFDWHQQGLNDGFAGRVARAGYWNSQCAQHGYPVNQRQYSQGWVAGNRQYCTTGQGYRQGRLGHQYQGTCQGDGEQQFLAGYRRGHAEYEKEQYRQSLYRQQRDLEQRIDDITAQLRADHERRHHDERRDKHDKDDDKARKDDAGLSHRQRRELQEERYQLRQQLMRINTLLLQLL
ncbi:DUF2799 domain-containing protein [Gallaecimonas sp. GXIMD1310]|uniref:DUF2799 domain-containing protein n=1 Tax=Gallaecimonas sp. GXIMD1310 TaxID=3131926 RepID=UPI00324C15AA